MVGDWNHDGQDDIGVCRNGLWILDSNGSKVYGATNAVFTYGGAGYIPGVGDWDGDGRDDFGVCRNGLWILDSTGTGRYNARDAVFAYG